MIEKVTENRDTMRQNRALAAKKTHNASLLFKSKNRLFKNMGFSWCPLDCISNKKERRQVAKLLAA